MCTKWLSIQCSTFSIGLGSTSRPIIPSRPVKLRSPMYSMSNIIPLLRPSASTTVDLELNRYPETSENEITFPGGDVYTNPTPSRVCVSNRTPKAPLIPSVLTSQSRNLEECSSRVQTQPQPSSYCAVSDSGTAPAFSRIFQLFFAPKKQ